jgi:hypothetical protein
MEGCLAFGERTEGDGLRGWWRMFPLSSVLSQRARRPAGTPVRRAQWRASPRSGDGERFFESGAGAALRRQRGNGPGYVTHTHALEARVQLAEQRTRVGQQAADEREYGDASDQHGDVEGKVAG